MQRTRDYYRYQRNRIIRKKLGILRRKGGENEVEAWTRGKSGKLSKRKIHCSCWMCRTKSYDYLSHSDLKKKGYQQECFAEYERCE